MKLKLLLVTFITAAIAMSCGNSKTKKPMQQKIDEYAEVTLTANLNNLSTGERQMLPFLIEAAKIMDNLFWTQAFGDKSALNTISDDAAREFVQINYGPWERLNGNKPFVEGFLAKPLGANFYPVDMTKEEFEELKDSAKTSQYTLIRRDEQGKLKVVPYHQYYKKELERAVNQMNLALLSCEDKDLKKYLKCRAEALLTDEYYESDSVWMDMRTNVIDFIVGPIESYEDALYGYKTAYEAFILMKDTAWSGKLEKFNRLMPDLQKSLPCDIEYKKESPGTNSDLAVYDVLYYAGDCNAGSKTIAINLPNDERVHVKQGTRKLQLKNAMRAKFDKILMPMAKNLIDKEQLDNVKFDAFFENVTFHEVAHGLGIKRTINGTETVRNALKDTYSTIEEAKADVAGLFLVKQLGRQGHLGKKELMDNYVTFVAGIFRSVRFGASSAHGKANMLTFNYLREKGAFERSANGTYKVNFERMDKAVDGLVREILTIQGDGNYEKASSWIAEKSGVKGVLLEDLNKIATLGIPKDIRFNQGPKALGLR
ncbi:MAG: Zn-dependent hydrolase [Prevotellaceae bacterium]|jgi:hypothetical protein|nr:Zn-dependent hydrolase [Prevotellaceae bacterium]